MIAIGDCVLSLSSEIQYYKTALRVRGSVWASDSFACIRVGTARGGNSETCAFYTISIYSVQKRELFIVIAQAPFRQGRVVVVS